MISLILLMAGSGTRMKMNKNKILLNLGNKPVYQYSIDRFKKYVDEIILVVNKLDYELFKDMPYKVIIGGETRFDSVLNGLNNANGDFVLIHDSARPFISYETIDKIIESANNNHTFLCYQKCNDTIKLNDNNITTLDRSKLIKAVTPQGGKKELFLKAYNMGLNNKNLFTDDISLIEKYFPDEKIDLILANDELFKLTTKIDYVLANTIWRDFSD